MEQSPASGHVAAACMRRIALPGLPAHDALRTAGRGQGRVAEEAASGKANSLLNLRYSTTDQPTEHTCGPAAGTKLLDL